MHTYLPEYLDEYIVSPTVRPAVNKTRVSQLAPDNTAISPVRPRRVSQKHHTNILRAQRPSVSPEARGMPRLNEALGTRYVVAVITLHTATPPSTSPRMENQQEKVNRRRDGFICLRIHSMDIRPCRSSKSHAIERSKTGTHRLALPDAGTTQDRRRRCHPLQFSVCNVGCCNRTPQYQECDSSLAFPAFLTLQ